MTKSFFVVIPYTPALIQSKGISPQSLFQKKQTDADITKRMENFEENRTQLEQRLAIVEQGLSRCGIRVAHLGTEEVIELFYKIFNPGETEKPIQLT